MRQNNSKIIKYIFQRNSKYKLLIIFSALLLLLLPFLKVKAFFLSFFTLFFIMAAIAASLDIVVGYMGYYDFGRAFFFGIGAYVAAIVQRDYGISPFLSMPLSFLICFIIGYSILAGARKLRGVYFAILTLALVYIINNLFLVLDYTGGPDGILLNPIGFDPYFNSVIFYEVSLIYLIIAALVAYFILRSKLGIAIRAIREDEEAAEMRGINTISTKSIGFAISGALTGVTGNIYAYYAGYIDPATVFSFIFSLNVMLMVLLGGMGTLYGPIIGTMIFTILSEVLRYSIPATLEGLHVVIFGSLLITVVLFAPGGVVQWLGIRSRKQ